MKHFNNNDWKDHLFTFGCGMAFVSTIVCIYLGVSYVPYLDHIIGITAAIGVSGLLIYVLGALCRLFYIDFIKDPYWIDEE